jgi:hypothetical protein
MADDNLDLDNIQASMNQLSGASQKLAQTLLDGGKLTRGEFRQLQNEMRGLAQASSSLRDNFLSSARASVKLGSELGRGTDGFTLLNTTVDIASSALKTLGAGISKIPGASKILDSTVGKIATQIGNVGVDVAQDVANYFISTFEEAQKSFVNLSKIGGVAEDGIKDMSKNIDQLGLPLAKYQNLVVQNANALAKMSGSVTNGTKAFVNAAGDMKRSGMDQGLRNLGFASEEISDTMIAYADLQRRLGNEQYMDHRRLQQGTMAYGKELDEIARLTGMSREQAQKEADAAMANARFNAKIRMLEAENTEQSLAAASNLRKMNAVYKQYGMEKGFQDMATGFINTKEAQEMFITSGGAAYNAIQGVAQGSMDFMQGLNEMQTGVKAMGGTLNSFALAGGDGPFHNFAQTMDFATASLDNLRTAADKQTTAQLTPDTATANLMAASVKLEDAAAAVQSAFMGTNTMPELMRDMAIGINDLTRWLTGFMKDSPKVQTDSGKKTSADLTTEKERINRLIQTGTLNNEQLENANSRLDEIIELEKRNANAAENMAAAITKANAPGARASSIMSTARNQQSNVNSDAATLIGNTTKEPDIVAPKMDRAPDITAPKMDRAPDITAPKMDRVQETVPTNDLKIPFTDDKEGKVSPRMRRGQQSDSTDIDIKGMIEQQSMTNQKLDSLAAGVNKLSRSLLS